MRESVKSVSLIEPWTTCDKDEMTIKCERCVFMFKSVCKEADFTLQPLKDFIRSIIKKSILVLLLTLILLFLCSRNQTSNFRNISCVILSTYSLRNVSYFMPVYSSLGTHASNSVRLKNSAVSQHFILYLQRMSPVTKLPQQIVNCAAWIAV